VPKEAYKSVMNEFNEEEVDGRKIIKEVFVLFRSEKCLYSESKISVEGRFERCVFEIEAIRFYYVDVKNEERLLKVIPVFIIFIVNDI
jgi:hypothetical protein